jgi:hypothetical protein
VLPDPHPYLRVAAGGRRGRGAAVGRFDADIVDHHALRELSARGPGRLVNDELGEDLWSKQIKIMESVRDNHIPRFRLVTDQARVL